MTNKVVLRYLSLGYITSLVCDLFTDILQGFSNMDGVLLRCKSEMDRFWDKPNHDKSCEYSEI